MRLTPRGDAVLATFTVLLVFVVLPWFGTVLGDWLVGA